MYILHASLSLHVEAQEEFKSLVDAGMTPTDYTYHKLMEGYTYHGDVSSIRSLFEEVKSRGININRYSCA